MNMKIFCSLFLTAVGLLLISPDKAFATGVNDAEWDKVFAKSDKVDVKKVTFKNRFGIELVGDLYEPKD